MTDIFQEIDDQLRQDRAAALWKRYGNYVIGAAVLVVVAVGGYRYWLYQDVSSRADESTRYQSAMAPPADADDAAAIEAFGALATEAGSGYAVLSRLQQAAAASRAGDGEGAVLAYQAVAGDDGAPAPLRDLARLKAAAQQLATAPGEGPPASLDPLAATGNPWRPMARELDAVRAMSSGDNDAAREIFTELADDSATPPGLRTRASEALKALKAK